MGEQQTLIQRKVGNGGVKHHCSLRNGLLMSLLNPKLLGQYDVPGPRYTSYPTADRFVGAFGHTQYIQALRQRQQGLGLRGVPLSVYVHIPFCASLCYYCACNKIITKQYSQAERYYLGKELSYFLNLASGGTKYQKGVISPTPDQIDFLAGQATGGVGREISKVEQAVTSAVTGEELPSYKVPLVGKFYGDVNSQASQANRFYDNITKMANYENEIKGRQKDRVATADFMAEHPEARLYQRANQLENEISKLNREKKDLVEKGADKSRIKSIEERKTRIMTQFNNQIENLEK